MMQSDHSNTNRSSHPPNPPANTNNNMSADEKVLGDISTLEEQISLCQSMLNESGTSIDSNEALLTVIGFLEACVPRMVELIEAAAQGALKEETFEKCLLVNDRLTNILADVDKDPKDRQPLTPAASASASASSGGIDLFEGGDGDDADSKMNQNMGNLKIDSSANQGKTTGLDSDDAAKKMPADPFAGGPDLLDPSPPANPFTIEDEVQSEYAAVTASTKVDDDDDFDAFFRDRTSASGGKSE